MRRQVRRTWRVFFEHNGDGPWTCYELTCGKPVTHIGRGRWDGNIHHLDEDKENDAPDNLVMMHTLCHQRIHEKTLELRQRISTKLKGRPSPTRGMHFSDEVNAKKSRPGESNPFFGKHHTDATRAKMRGIRRRITCDKCGRDYAVNWINRHWREGLCTERSTH